VISQLDVKKMKQHSIIEIIWEDQEWMIRKSKGRKKRNQYEDRTMAKISFAVQQRNRNIDT